MLKLCAKKIRILFLLCLLFASMWHFFFPVYIVDLSSIPYFSSNKARSSIDDLIALAQRGDAVAQQRLAYKYDKGIGVSVDLGKAYELNKKSAKQGNVKAQNNLGALYEMGRGVAKNEERAIFWYEKAAEQGYLLAQMNLAGLYHRREQYKDSFPWVLQAAEQGDALSQNMLCVMYEIGKGVEKDIEKSVYWCKTAADKGDPDAIYNLGRYYYKQGQFEQAYELYKKAAEHGVSGAQNNIGHMYNSGKGVAVDFKESGYWYRQAANNGFEPSKEYLEKVKNSCVSSYEPSRYQVNNCFVAAGAGIVEAQSMLSLLYYYGRGVPKDNIEALAWSLVNDHAKSMDELKKPIFSISYVVMSGLLKKLGKDDIEQANIKASEYKEKFGTY